MFATPEHKVKHPNVIKGCGECYPVSRPGATNIEARALAVVLKATPNDRDLAAEARHGGRALTRQLAHFGGPAISREMMAADPSKAWHYHIDPSGSYGWDDPRREAEAKRGWQRIARYGVEGRDPDWGRPLPYLTDGVDVTRAEAMLDWPIYRAAIAGQVLRPIGDVLYPPDNEDEPWDSDTIEEVAWAYNSAREAEGIAR